MTHRDDLARLIGNCPAPTDLDWPYGIADAVLAWLASEQVVEAMMDGALYQVPGFVASRRDQHEHVLRQMRAAVAALKQEGAP